MAAETGRRGFDRCDWLMVAVLAGAFVWMLCRTPATWGLVGFSTDDGTYLASAKSLAEGRGYRHANLPGEPLQTKYPPVYPLVLSLIWRVFPDFPQNLRHIVLLHAALAAVAAWLAYGLIRARWGISPWLAVAGITVAITNPHLWTLVQVPMSEIPYAALSLGVLLLGWRAAAPRGQKKPGGHQLGTREARTADLPLAGPADPPLATPADPPVAATPADLPLAASPVGPPLAASPAGPPSLVGLLLTAVVAGLLSAAANLTRSIGFAVVAALLLFFLLLRRWRALVVAAFACAVPLAIWSLWRAAARATNQADPTTAAFVYDLDYAAWLPQDLAGWAWVAYLNAGRLLSGAALRLVLVPEAWVIQGVQGSSGALALTWLYFVVVVALVVLGLIVAARRGEWLSPLYIAIYWGLLTLWPGALESSRRFQIPLLPLLAPALLSGVRTLVAALTGDRPPLSVNPPNVAPSRTSQTGSGTRARQAGRPFGVAEGAALVIGTLLIVSNLYTGYTMGRALALSPRAAHREELAAYIRDNLPQDAVIAADSAGYLWLRTGRKVVLPAPVPRFLPLAYPADAHFRHAGLVIGEQTLAAFRQLMREELPAYYRQTGATHLVFGERGGPAAFAHEFIATDPARFRLRATLGPYEIYEVH